MQAQRYQQTQRRAPVWISLAYRFHPFVLRHSNRCGILAFHHSWFVERNLSGHGLDAYNQDCETASPRLSPMMSFQRLGAISPYQ